MANDPPLKSTSPPVLVRLPDVQRALSLGRTSVNNLVRTDPTFPRPVRLTKRAVAWFRDEVEAWARTLPRVERPAQTAEGDRAARP